MASVAGPKIILSGPSDSLELNCPIKRIIMLGGNSFNLRIDGQTLFVAPGRDICFCSINGYPGARLQTDEAYSGSASFVIEEIGDVLNPNYFKEDIRNWNGQGAAAVATAAETEAEPTVSKATRSKKAEVTE